MKENPHPQETYSVNWKRDESRGGSRGRVGWRFKLPELYDIRPVLFISGTLNLKAQVKH
jgi:hypothetical protein